MSPEVLPTPEVVQFEEDVMRLAAWSHDVWRLGRPTRRDGSFKPRLKTTNDQEWIVAHDGQTVVDIANVGFEDLPIDRQAETVASAREALSEAYKVAFYGEGQYREGQNYLFIGHHIQFSSSNIHDRWLDRNGEWAPRSQRLPFEQLSVAEQKKDEDIYIGAASVVNQRLEDGSFCVPAHMIIEWCNKDLEFLSKLSASGSVPNWQFIASEAQLVGGRRVWLELNCARDGLALYGVYPLEESARFVSVLCDLSPDSDPSEVGLRGGGDSVRQAYIERFLAAIATLGWSPEGFRS